MGWGAPLGFSSSKTPLELANTAIVGEPGFFLHYQAKPRPDLPDRAKITFPTGFAIINNVAEAIRYLTTEQSGCIHAAAALYLGKHEREEGEVA